MSLIRWILLLVVAVLPSAACGVLRVPHVPDLGDHTAHEVLTRARDQNWTVRVRVADDEFEGRVRFVQHDSARIGNASIAVGGISMIQRTAPTDLGGRPAGAVVGGVVGLLFGYLARELVEYAGERRCGIGCTLAIYGPSVGVIGLMGAFVGSIVNPPTNEWITIWREAP